MFLTFVFSVKHNRSLFMQQNQCSSTKILFNPISIKVNGHFTANDSYDKNKSALVRHKPLMFMNDSIKGVHHFL